MFDSLIFGFETKKNKRKSLFLHIFFIKKYIYKELCIYISIQTQAVCHIFSSYQILAL